MKTVFSLTVVAALVLGGQVATAQQPTSLDVVTTRGQVQQYLRQGREAQKKGDLDGATQAYLKVVKLDKSNEEAWQRMAWICNEKEDHKTATMAALIVLKTNNRNSEAWKELGYAEWKLGKRDEAIISLTRAIECNRHNYGAYDYLSVLLIEKGMPATAAAVQQKKAQAQADALPIDF